MKHYLNVCDVNGAEVEPVDVITFGSPCQDLSVAGKRAGLKHESNGDEETTRSGLFMEAVRIIKEMRNKDEELRSGRSNEHIRPRFAVWENAKHSLNTFGKRIATERRLTFQQILTTVGNAGLPALLA